MVATETEKYDLGHWELEFRVSHRTQFSGRYEEISHKELHDIDLIHIIFNDEDGRKMDVDLTRHFPNLTNLTDSELEERQTSITRELREKLFKINMEFATNRGE